jgi:hypothetical protein
VSIAGAAASGLIMYASGFVFTSAIVCVEWLLLVDNKFTGSSCWDFATSFSNFGGRKFLRNAKTLSCSTSTLFELAYVHAASILLFTASYWKLYCLRPYTRLGDIRSLNFLALHLKVSTVDHPGQLILDGIRTILARCKEQQSVTNVCHYLVYRILNTELRLQDRMRLSEPALSAL